MTNFELDMKTYVKMLYYVILLSGLLFVFLKIIIHLSLRSIGHLKKKKFQIGQFSSCLDFCNYVILGGHFLSISKTIFTKLMFHLRLSDQLPDVLLEKFDIHSTSVIYLCIKNNFNVLISKLFANFS